MEEGNEREELVAVKQNFTVYAAKSPNESNQERLVRESLERNTMPGDLIRNMAPQRNLFPPRFGYEMGEPTIQDVLATDYMNPDFRALVSGAFSGTSRPSGTGWW